MIIIAFTAFMVFIASVTAWVFWPKIEKLLDRKRDRRP